MCIVCCTLWFEALCHRNGLCYHHSHFICSHIRNSFSHLFVLIFSVGLLNDQFLLVLSIVIQFYSLKQIVCLVPLLIISVC